MTQPTVHPLRHPSHRSSLFDRSVRHRFSSTSTALSSSPAARPYRRPTRLEAQQLQHRLPLPLTEDHTLVIPERHAPHCVARPAQLADELPSPYIPQLHPPVVASRDDEPVIKLQAGHAVIVCAKPMEARIGREVEYDHPAVRSARDEQIAVELQLAYERRVALQEGQTCAGVSALRVSRRPAPPSGGVDHCHRPVSCQAPLTPSWRPIPARSSPDCP